MSANTPFTPTVERLVSPHMYDELEKIAIDGATIERTSEQPMKTWWEDKEARVPHNSIERLEALTKLERSFMSTKAMRKAKKRERLNRAKGRRR